MRKEYIALLFKAGGNAERNEVIRRWRVYRA